MREELIQNLRRYFEQRGADLHVNVAYLYGSWASGMPRKDSDVDIGVVFSESVTTEKAAFKIIAEMEIELGRILKKEVSVIRVQTESWKPMFYYNVVVLGLPVFCKDLALNQSLRWRAIAQMEDFKIFGVFWQLHAAKRNLKRGK